jgi:hypothetical protein
MAVVIHIALGRCFCLTCRRFHSRRRRYRRWGRRCQRFPACKHSLNAPIGPRARARNAGGSLRQVCADDLIALIHFAVAVTRVRRVYLCKGYDLFAQVHGDPFRLGRCYRSCSLLPEHITCLLLCKGFLSGSRLLQALHKQCLLVKLLLKLLGDGSVCSLCSFLASCLCLLGCPLQFPL